MRRSITAFIAAIILAATFAFPALADKPSSFDTNGNVASTVTDNGFNSYGYNYTARIFSGTYLSWCAEQGISSTNCASIVGATYVNDQLIMKWNAAWDACNASGLPVDCAGAWITNEQNGQVPGGSGAVWHYKIVWSSVCAAGGAPTDGGYCVWGGYEVIMDQGIDPNVGPGHTSYALATPNGFR